MNSKTNIVLFVGSDTSGNPWSRVELEDEIRVISLKFRHILVVPVADSTLLSQYVFPENVELVSSIHPVAGFLGRLKRVRHLFGLLYKYRDLTGFSRKSISFLLSAMDLADVIRRFIIDAEIDCGSTLFLVPWFDTSTAALALLSRRSGVSFGCGGLTDWGLTDSFPRLRELSAAQCESIRIPGNVAAGRVCCQIPGMEAKVTAELPAMAWIEEFTLAAHHSLADRSLTFMTVADAVASAHVIQIYLFLKALAVARPSTRVKWIFVGDGPLMAELRNMIGRDTLERFEVYMPGSLSPDQMRRLYSLEPVDWTIQLDSSDFFPLSAFASLAHGVPVVAVASDAVDEILTDDCALLLAPDSEPEEFIRGILPYIESDYRMDHLRRSASTRFRQIAQSPHPG